MTLYEKIKTLQKKHPDQQKLLLGKEELIWLIGENYKEKEIHFNASVSWFILEEKNFFYTLTLHKDSPPIKNTEDLFYIIINTYSNLAYSRFDENTVRVLKRRKKYQEEHLFDRDRERELKAIHEVLNHPKIRLKALFMKEEA